MVPQTVWLIARKKPLGALSAVVLVLMVTVAIFANQIATHDPIAQDIPNRLKPPGTESYMGTDSFGRDTFSRVVHGSRISLYIGLVSVTLGTVMGASIGIASAYFGGKFDLSIQRVVDALLAFPSLVLALVMVTALGASLNNVAIAVIVAITPQIVRLSRSLALSVKEEAYILGAQAIGASSLRVMLRHVLPNSLAPVLVQATGYLEQAVVTEAALSFLGLGVPPPHPSWGRMLQEGGHGYLEAAPWLAIFPGLALSLAVFSFALLGDALRDVLDPRLSIRGSRPQA